MPMYCLPSISQVLGTETTPEPVWNAQSCLPSGVEGLHEAVRGAGEDEPALGRHGAGQSGIASRCSQTILPVLRVQSPQRADMGVELALDAEALAEIAEPPYR